MKGRGRFYQGKMNKTEDGLDCQRWDSQYPHTYQRPPSFLPELQGAENYCRNAGGEEPRPWCFTTNSSIRWRHCNVPKCTNSTEEIELKKGINMNAYSSPMFVLIASGITLLSLVVLLLLALLCHRIHKHRLGYNPARNSEVAIDLDKLPSNVAYHR